IGISVGGDTYLPSGFPIFMYEYGWAPDLSPGPGVSSGYYVGILEDNNTKGLGYFLTTQVNPQVECQTYDNSLLCSNGYYDYYYSGSSGGGSNNYYFLEDNTGSPSGYSGSNYYAFMPLDQQQNQFFRQPYSQYGLFWLYNWFQAGGGNMNIYFLMNGNIFNYSLASTTEHYIWECAPQTTCNESVIPPNPPASTINGEPIFAQSYINAYNTAFNQETQDFTANYQVALNHYSYFTYIDVNSNFVNGTFGYDEEYNGQGSNLGNSITIGPLQDNENYYNGNPYLFISAGSGGGSGYMYLDWVIVTYGVPYVASVS
ncbi:MAG: hypothetical protein RXQ68_00745, partial [Candidatus Nanopusillus sp.]